MVQFILNFLADELLVVAVPRVLVLRNKRLGLFHKLVQISCFIVIVAYSVNERIFMIESTVDAWGVNLWREDGPPAHADANWTLSHCQDVFAYASNTDEFNYMPTACKALPNEEAHFSKENKLFLATFIDDLLVWDGTGERCGTAAQQACRQNAEAVYEEADGRCSCLRWQLVRGFVDIIVLVQVPSFVAQFVAMYLMGVTSEVYRHTARTKLNIFAKFHNTVAKLMLAEVAFRGLVSDFSSHIDDLESLTPQLLLLRLQDVLSDVIRAGGLLGEEVVRMACSVFMTMDRNKNDSIECREFIESCTNDGEITMQRMARYFHNDDHKMHSLRKLLDDTHVVAQKTASQNSFYENVRQGMEDGATCSAAVRAVASRKARPSEESSGTDLQATAEATMEQICKAHPKEEKQRLNLANEALEFAPKEVKVIRVDEHEYGEGKRELPLPIQLELVCEDSARTNMEQPQEPKPPLQGDIERLESVFARLAAQERHCHRALELLRDASDQRSLGPLHERGGVWV